MEVREAVLTVLREEAGPLHWTRIQDLALRRGYVDPFQTEDVRARVLEALAAAVREGEVEKRDKGVYKAAG
jgi:hypothetical protein